MSQTKTAKEVLMHAMTLAGVNNLGFTDFFNIVALTNNLYRRIYEKVATAEDGYYDCEFTFEGNRCSLPSDLFVIKRVIRMNGDTEIMDLNRQAGQTFSAGQYSIRNDELIISGNNCAKIKVIYAPMPKTLTIPDKPELIGIDPNGIKRVIGMNDKEFYYEDTAGSGHVYNFRKKTDTIDGAVLKIPTTNEYKYFGGTLTLGDGVYTYKDVNGSTEDVTEVLQAGNRSGIKRVIVWDPYIAVTYNDKTIKMFNGWEAADYNIFAYKGRETLGDILAMCTNDYTGKGVIFHSDFDGKLYYNSFVPDTILNYPEQADFSLLEMKLALMLAQMAGTNSAWLESEIAILEKDFTDQIQRCKSSVMRVNNVRPQRAFFR